MTTGLAALALLAAAALLTYVAMRIASARLFKEFTAALGPVVRIATRCRRVKDWRLVPAAVGLTRDRLVWWDVLGGRGEAAFGDVTRLETDRRLASGRPLLRAQALRVGLESGAVEEFVLPPALAHEWRRALGEWVGRENVAARESGPFVTPPGGAAPHAL